MTTPTTAALTPKQKQVADLVTKGLAVNDIARRLKISPSGVRTHIRNLEALGVELPSVESDDTPATVTSSPSPVAGDPAGALNAARAAGTQRLAEIDDSIAALTADVSMLQAQRLEVEAQLAKYSAALEALA